MYKKIFYLHVGKTAGTSMNRYIASHFAPDDSKTHIENDPLWSTEHKQNYISKSFLSGHVSFVRFLKVFDKNEYYKFATFRRPIDHIISHLAWVRHLSDPGKEAFLAGHPGWVQEISRKLTLINFADPDSIEHFVKHLSSMECALFDNSQTRYLLAIPGHQMVNKPKMREALQNLEQLDLAGITELYNESVALLSHDMGWELPLHGERLNAAATKYDLDGSRPEIREALKPLIWADNHIYRQAKDKLLNRIAKLLVSPAADDVQKTSEEDVIPVMRGNFDVATPRLLAGWVIVEGNPSAIVYLRISVNNRDAYFIRADKCRNDIKEKGIHPTGQCGFSLQLPVELSLKPGDKVVIRAMGLNKNLFGSPRIITE